jgi:tetratricopeptide (TPR) repeat protein
VDTIERDTRHGTRRTPRLIALVLLLLGSAACRQQPARETGKSAGSGPLDEARALLEQGQFDAALAKSLDPSADNAEALCLQGQIWARKAERAPLPVAGDGAERPPEFKSEELRAIDLFERARATRPTLSEAHLGLASLLAPHAVRRFELTQAGRRVPKATRAVAASPASAEETDFSIPRVAALYQEAVKQDPKGLRAVDELQRFAQRIRDKDLLAWSYREGIARDRENPDRLVQLGDFLEKERGDRHGAIEQYRQAIIWRPDDDNTKAKLATLYIALAREHLTAQQWGAAQMMFDEAQKYAAADSPQAVQIRAGLEELGAIRRTDQR